MLILLMVVTLRIKWDEIVQGREVTNGKNDNRQRVVQTSVRVHGNNY